MHTQQTKTFFDLPLEEKQVAPLKYNRGYIGLYEQRYYNYKHKCERGNNNNNNNDVFKYF